MIAEYRFQQEIHLACDLPPRRRQVLELIADGLTTLEIAHRLRISTSTVEFHRDKLVRQTRSNGFDIAGLTKLAIRLGLANVNDHRIYA